MHINKISIIIPVYFNVDSLQETVNKALDVETPEAKKEILLIDDGSLDQSWELIESLEKKHNEVHGIKLLKNYGSMIAIMKGIQNASGDCMVILTADLQDPPELIKKMYNEWLKGYKTVLAVRTNREDSFTTKLYANLYYKLVRLFAFKDYPKGGFDFVLFDKVVANHLINMKEKNTNPLMQIYWLGYNKSILHYERKEREFGKSRWTLKKKLKLFSDSFIGFSYVPIRMMSVIGAIVAFGSLCFAIYQLLLKLFFDVPVQGYTTIMITILFLGGLQISLFSILGEYIWRVLDQVRDRPDCIVEKKIGFKD